MFSPNFPLSEEDPDEKETFGVASQDINYFPEPQALGYRTATRQPDTHPQAHTDKNT